VLLLISDLNILQDELSIFEQIYTESRRNLVGVDGKSHMPYEVVWVPVVDPIEDFERSPILQKKFEDLRDPMPWYLTHLFQNTHSSSCKERWRNIIGSYFFLWGSGIQWIARS